MRLLLIILLLLHWPPALSLSTSETTPGASLTAVATAPEGAQVALQLPVGVSAELLERQGQTVRWRLTVAEDAPLDRTPHQVVLLVGGQEQPARHCVCGPRRCGGSTCGRRSCCDNQSSAKIPDAGPRWE